MTYWVDYAVDLEELNGFHFNSYINLKNHNFRVTETFLAIFLKLYNHKFFHEVI